METSTSLTCHHGYMGTQITLRRKSQVQSNCKVMVLHSTVVSRVIGFLFPNFSLKVIQLQATISEGLDAIVLVSHHVNRTSHTQLYHLRQLCNIRHSISAQAVTTLVHVQICTRVDCGTPFIPVSLH